MWWNQPFRLNKFKNTIPPLYNPYFPLCYPSATPEASPTVEPPQILNQTPWPIPQLDCLHPFYLIPKLIRLNSHSRPWIKVKHVRTLAINFQITRLIDDTGIPNHRVLSPHPPNYITTTGLTWSKGETKAYLPEQLWWLLEMDIWCLLMKTRGLSLQVSLIISLFKFQHVDLESSSPSPTLVCMNDSFVVDVCVWA